MRENKLFHLSAFFIFILVVPLLAQGPEQESRENAEIKTITGEVGGISPNFIAIMYGSDSKSEIALEMALSIDKNVQVEHKESLKEIGFGDTVTVAYEEKSAQDPEGNIRVKSRVAKKITFLKAAQQIQETGALQSIGG
jgi:hypothetical protein